MRATGVPQRQEVRPLEHCNKRYIPTDGPRHLPRTRTRKLSREPAACEGGTLTVAFVILWLTEFQPQDNPSGASMTNPPHRKTRETFNTPGEAHELTFTCFKYQKFLTKDRTRQYVIDSLNRSRKKYAFDIWAYVIMPEHIHLLIFPTEEEYDVSKILKSVKSSVAKKAMNYLRSHNPEGLKYLATGYATQPYTFWMEGGGYDRNAIKKETVDFMVNYIHNNPVRRGLVEQAEDWRWSSMQEHLNPGTGPLRLDLDSYPY